MATLTIRNLDEELKALLRLRAAANGRSMEEEVRSILRETLDLAVKQERLGSRLAAHFAGKGMALPIPPRTTPRTPPDFTKD